MSRLHGATAHKSFFQFGHLIVEEEDRYNLPVASFNTVADEGKEGGKGREGGKKERKNLDTHIGSTLYPTTCLTPSSPMRIEYIGLASASEGRREIMGGRETWLEGGRGGRLHSGAGLAACPFVGNIVVLSVYLLCFIFFFLFVHISLHFVKITGGIGGDTTYNMSGFWVCFANFHLFPHFPLYNAHSSHYIDSLFAVDVTKLGGVYLVRNV